VNALYQGDACAVCDALDARVRFDLAYLDPPYSVGAVMAMRERAGQARGKKKSASGRDAYLDAGDPVALVASLEPLFARIRERLSERGAFYLHMDWRAVHEAKVAADRVFGRRAFAGEVVWTPGNGSRGARAFAVTHQTILVYAARDRKRLPFAVDHPLLREPFAGTSQKMHFTKVDDAGRHYRERIIAGKRYRYYADEGRRIGSVWTDIPAMVANTPLRREATGYPTQKPERLLERIVRASSAEGDTVADVMCGSGTTLVVAARLGRRFVGGDASDVAIEIARKRLDAAGVSYRYTPELRAPSVTE
jgi:site-specific DNA-methyltransferase (adenine-specific)